MIIRRVNDTTINCIITQEDLQERGIGIDDLFDKKKEAVEYIRSVIAQAARKENFDVGAEFTTMRLSILPDSSVSLTLSQDPGEHRAIRDAVHNVVSEVVATHDAYVYRFDSIRDLAKCCKSIVSDAVRGDLDGALYQDNDGSYLMIFMRSENKGSDFEGRVLYANEFGTLLTCEETVIAYIREHINCIIEKNAVKQIAALYD